MKSEQEWREWMRATQAAKAAGRLKAVGTNQQPAVSAPVDQPAVADEIHSEPERFGSKAARRKTAEGVPVEFYAGL